MTEPSDVVAAALTLPRSERAELAHKLILSLDETPDDPKVVKAEWDAELLRRLHAVESGEMATIPMEEVFRQLKQ